MSKSEQETVGVGLPTGVFPRVALLGASIFSTSVAFVFFFRSGSPGFNAGLNVMIAGLAVMAIGGLGGIIGNRIGPLQQSTGGEDGEDG